MSIKARLSFAFARARSVRIGSEAICGGSGQDARADDGLGIVGSPDLAGWLAARLAQTDSVVRLIDDRDLEPPRSDLDELLVAAKRGSLGTLILAFNSVEALQIVPILQPVHSMLQPIGVYVFPRSGLRPQLEDGCNCSIHCQCRW